MVQLIFVKLTMHPALRMVMMESSKFDARPGMTWAAWAPAGRSGWLRVQVGVDCSLSPLGRRTMRGTAARTMLMAGALVVRKWLVAQESRMTHCLMAVALVVIVLKMMEAVCVCVCLTSSRGGLPSDAVPTAR